MLYNMRNNSGGFMKKFALAFVIIFFSSIVFGEDLKTANQAAISAQPVTAAVQLSNITVAPAAVTSQPEAGTVTEKTIIVYDPSKHVKTSTTIFWSWAAASFGSGIIAAVNGSAETHGLGVGMMAYGIAETLIAIYDNNFSDWPSSQEDVRKMLVDQSGSHAMIGLAQLAAGICIGILSRDNLRGFGYAMAIQGGFFSISNGINYIVASAPGYVNTMGAGASFISPIACLNF
jgi:hypothetical protein